MSTPRAKKSSGRRPTQARPPKPADLWRPVPQLPEPDDITPATDPTALLRSLGDPPLPRNGLIAGRYFTTVVERAAAMATALAASVELLADTESDTDTD
jgi:hypothetical protein